MFTDPAYDVYDEMYDEPFIGPLTEEDQYWADMPCGGCMQTWPCAKDCPEQAYNDWMAKRIDRLGIELAMLPDEIECYACGRHLPVRICQHNRWGQPYMMRRVVGQGPTAEAHRDPTSTYRLVCGHIEM